MTSVSGNVQPTVLGFCYPTPVLAAHREPAAKTVITARDTRWLRGTRKSISLLGGVLGAIEASEAGAEDAILIRDGVVAEGTSSNVFVVTTEGQGRMRIATPSLESAPILAGVTRDLLIEAAPEIEVRTIHQSELERASEVMLAGTLTMVTSVLAIDGRKVGDGTIGPAARMLLDRLVGAIRSRRGAEAAVAGR